MNFSIDDYAHLDSPLHRWDPRYKLVGMLVVMFAFAAVKTMLLLPAMLLVSVGFVVASRLPVSFLLTRLHYPGLFLLALVLSMPFLVGQTIVASLGPLALRYEGIQAALLIATRFLCILSLSIVLFGTSPFLTTVRAMYALGLPAILNDMMLLFYRYLLDMAAMATTMQTAMRVRGFQPNRLTMHHMRMLASLAGTLLVRSYEQADRVYHAMRLRGYGSGQRPTHLFRAGAGDVLALCGTLVLAVGFVVADGVIPRLAGVF